MQDEDTQTTGSTGAVPADDTSTDVSGGAPVGGVGDVGGTTPPPATPPVEEETPVTPEVPVEEPEVPETPAPETPVEETPAE